MDMQHSLTRGLATLAKIVESTQTDGIVIHHQREHRYGPSRYRAVLVSSQMAQSADGFDVACRRHFLLERTDDEPWWRNRQPDERRSRRSSPGAATRFSVSAGSGANTGRQGAMAEA